ncbi:hypothetical protein F0U62_08390 [Cystobacter fuscus]|uniref:hypothetical protein n=1 Tax=Cystobacter fuscus TaxID=43 RepID=UPI002B2EB938|nr:hypothetical protein F0U62_08390 [Cystobacter fuscus]
MNGNKKLKKQIRERMARNGESYTDAMMHVLRCRASNQQGSFADQRAEFVFAASLRLWAADISRFIGELQQGLVPFAEIAGALQQQIAPFAEGYLQVAEGIHQQIAPIAGVLQQQMAPFAEIAEGIHQQIAPIAEIAGVLQQQMAPFAEGIAQMRQDMISFVEAIGQVAAELQRVDGFVSPSLPASRTTR